MSSVLGLGRATSIIVFSSGVSIIAVCGRTGCAVWLAADHVVGADHMRYIQLGECLDASSELPVRVEAVNVKLSLRLPCRSIARRAALAWQRHPLELMRWLCPACPLFYVNPSAAETCHPPFTLHEGIYWCVDKYISTKC